MKNLLLTIALLLSLPAFANISLDNLKFGECALKALKVPGTLEHRGEFIAKCTKTDTEQQTEESLFNTHTEQQSKEFVRNFEKQSSPEYFRQTEQLNKQLFTVAKKCAEQSGIPYSYELIEIKNKKNADLSPKQLSFKKCMHDNGWPIDKSPISIKISNLKFVSPAGYN